MILEKPHKTRLMPVGVPKLDGEFPAVREREDKIAEGGGVALRRKGGRELEEDRAEMPVKRLHRLEEFPEAAYRSPAACARG